MSVIVKGMEMPKICTYRYGMRLRGFSPGCQPKDGFIGREDDPNGRYYDIVVYERPLTMEEIMNYELDYLGEID